MKGLAKTGHQGFSKALRGCALGALLLCLAANAPAQSVTVSTNHYIVPWIADVVKMSAAGVPQDVIQVYIKNSSARSTLTPDDIVYLRDNGVASGIINVMIEHGAMQTPTTYVAAQPQAATQAPVYAPTPQYYEPPVAYYEQPSTSVTYIGEPYPSYPYYYNYGYSYPFYYPPVFFIGSRFGFRRGFDFSRGFHGLRSPGFRAGSVGFHSTIAGRVGGAVHTGRR